jgi:hypothetical protein
MLSRNERDRLESIGRTLDADDPGLAKAIRDGRPHPPREYRAARRRMLAYAGSSASTLILAVIANPIPALSGGLLLLCLASGMAAIMTERIPNADRPDEHRPR